MKASRRTVLKGAAGAGAVAAMGGVRLASAQDATPEALNSDLRKQILAIPGVGKGSPTEADMQKVGELCLDSTKASVAQGEFSGVELNFLGLNNQGLHNYVFRALLKGWVDYTGAKIN